MAGIVVLVFGLLGAVHAVTVSGQEDSVGVSAGNIRAETGSLVQPFVCSDSSLPDGEVDGEPSLTWLRLGGGAGVVGARSVRVR